MKQTRRTAILSLALCLALAGCAGPAAAPASSGPAGAGSTDYIPIRDWAGCTP